MWKPGILWFQSYTQLYNPILAIKIQTRHVSKNVSHVTGHESKPLNIGIQTNALHNPPAWEIPLPLRSLLNCQLRFVTLHLPTVTYPYVYYYIYCFVLELSVTPCNLWAPWVRELCLTRDVSPAPSPVPGTLQSLDTGLLNASVTEDERNPARRLSLKVLHGSTKHIHCLNWKCPKFLLHLSYLPYLKIIPFSSYLFFTQVHSIPITVVTTSAPSVRESTAYWKEPHTCPLETRFLNSKQAFAGRCSSTRQLMNPFNEFLGSLKMVNFLARLWPYKVMSLPPQIVNLESI